LRPLGSNEFYFEGHLIENCDNDAIFLRLGKPCSRIQKWNHIISFPKVTSKSVLSENCDDRQLCIVSILPHILDCQAECRNNYIQTLKAVGEYFKAKMWGWVRPLLHHRYWKIISICWEFSFVYFMGGKNHKFKIPTKCWFNHFLIWKFTNSGVRGHVYHQQTTKFHAHKINWFHSILFNKKLDWAIWITFVSMVNLE